MPKKKIPVMLLAVSLIFGLTGCGVKAEQQEETTTEYVEAVMENGQVKPEEPVRPQDDYYGYINKDTLQSLEVNFTDSVAGPTADIEETVQEELYRMIQDIAYSGEDYAPGSNEQIVRDAYQQMLGYLEDRESDAKAYYLSLAEKIQASDSLEDIKDNLNLLMTEGIISYFDMRVDDNYFDGENYALYLEQKVTFGAFKLKDIYEQNDIRQALHAYATEVLVSTGIKPEDAGAQADDFVYFMIDIACDTDYSVEEAANPFLTLVDTPNTDMNRILSGITIEDIEEIYGVENPYGSWVIQDAEQLTALSSHFTEDNIENLKLYMLCDLMYAYRDFLQEDYPFLKSCAMKVTMEHERMAAYVVSGLFGSEISELYAKYYYTEEMDAELQKMYEDIVLSYDELICEATWLTEDTREDLLKKLHNMVFVSGGGIPHEVHAEDAKVIGEDAFCTMVNVNKRKVQRAKENIGKKLNKAESSMLSQVVNSQYSPCNTFTITVAIMHAPYFDVNADYATNLGGLGMVMAHEIGHAFDSNCIAYDADGVYNPDRICKEDQEKIAARLKQMEAYYSGFTIMDIYHVDGVKTSGENYADKGAMECLMHIVKTKEEQKKLFENYAYIWCMLTEDSLAIDNLMEDVHSPNEVRVNAVLSSTKEFYDLYDVTEGDGMYVAPEKRISRW